MQFEDVVYHIKTEKAGFLKNNAVSTEEKLILKGISGVVLPGEMLAMMGPSGSGKTTLLTALGGRLGGHLGGTIAYNGKPFPNTMKRNTGFVTQDDVLYPHLTVTDTLVYTALLRLPKTLTTQEKVQKAEAVINQLGLSRCRDSIIGGPLLRGISGGERKRVSIGQEMLINPSLLFLDEPTSGLDSTTAQRIVSTLRELANGGRTVVMTIHQPSSRLFYMFHKVLLLSDGNPIYFGKCSDALDYFSNVGFAPPVTMNPADFLLDLANELGTIDNQVSDSTEDKQFKRWSNTWWRQFSVLFRRGLRERKHEIFAVHKIVQVLIVAIVSGLLWWQSDIRDLQDQVFRHVCLSSFFMTLILGDLPMVLVLPTTYFIITYWMAGLKATASAFLLGLLANLYNVLSSQGLGLAIGAVVMDQKSVSVLGSVIVLVFQLAGGYYVQNVPIFIRWIKYISINQYAFKLLLGTQYKVGETYTCGTNNTCLVKEFPTIKTAGLDGQLVAVIALAVMLVGYRMIAYLALMRIGVTKK
ncbi:hypothetical protein BUALT_Bualt03G0133600 [Buddleja alternifolia]|uniref:ABC transporter domain-containing protein n=1 Tax=Buddleja alternifolia TaxID=168488 RepID=A0AAV6XUK3_9LAMI|nr:hypothetical protein BUALT_Bualt03G0133600 [Buddleja alternifolia]